MFADNEADLSRLFSGRGGAPVDNRIFQKVLQWEHDCRLVEWYERVLVSDMWRMRRQEEISGLNPSLEIDFNLSGVAKRCERY